MGAALESRLYLNEYVGGKDDDLLVNQVTKLAKFAVSHP